MRKTLLLLCAFVAAIAAKAQDVVTFDFATGYIHAVGENASDTQGWIYNETFTDQSLSLQVVTGTSPCRNYADNNRGNCFVIYKGGSLIFSAPGGKAITKIEFTAAGNSNINKLIPSSGTNEGMVWSGNADGVRFAQGATSYLASIAVTIADKNGETVALPAIEYTNCANIAEFNALADGACAKVTLTDAEVIGVSADGYSSAWIQDATGGTWIQYTSINASLKEKDKISGYVYVTKDSKNGNPVFREAEGTVNSQFTDVSAVESFTIVEGTIDDVNVAANLNKVVKISGATLTMTSATNGTLTLGESSIGLNNGGETAIEQLHKITGWEKDKVFEYVTITAILVAKSATANQLLPISVKVPELILTLDGTAGEEVSLTFGAYDTEDEYTVDFGTGDPQTKKVGVNNAGPVNPDTGQTGSLTVFTGTVGEDGTIKVYGTNDIWYFNSSGAMPTTLDQEKLMNVVQMTISGANVESVALPEYTKMTQFSLTNTPVKSVDLSKATTLTRIDIYNTTQSAYEPQLKTLDVSKNVNLETIVVGGNTYKKGELTSLDFTTNTKLTQISAENNKLTSVTGIPVSVKNIYLSNNELASLTFPELTSKGTIQIQNNKFTLATLPTKPSITTTSKYTYAPQPAYKVPGIVKELDLSSQLTATGVGTEPATTTYSFATATGTALVEGTDYEVTAPGKFKFLKDQTEKIHGVMATTAFPKFTGANAYATTDFLVGFTPLLTLNAYVGDEVSIKAGVYAPFDIFAVDFGDGVLVVDSVGHQNKGVCVDDGTETWPQKEGTLHKGITEFKGTAAGDGAIKIYGTSDIWYLGLSGTALVSMDQEKVKKVVQFTMSKVNLSSLDLTGLNDLEQFSLTQSSLKSINLSTNTKLKNLTINNNTASTYPSILESLDLTNNVNLEQLNVMGASAEKPGVLKELDLSNNPKLTNLYAQNNALTSVKLPAGAALSFANLQNNQLESVDLTTVASFKDTYLNNNKLTAVDLSKLKAGANLYLDGNQLTEVTIPVSVKNLQLNNNKLTSVSLVDATASCKLENNNLTLATIPAQPAGMNSEGKTKKFTYVPQAALAVDETLSELDLSSQLTVAKGELNPADSYASWLGEKMTTYRVVLPSGVSLVEGIDYVSPQLGKFKFLKDQTEKVHVMMLNDALPKFTESAPFVTTEFTVSIPTEPEPTAIKDLNAAAAAGKAYNLQGVEVKQPVKGLYILNGKKVVIK